MDYYGQLKAGEQEPRGRPLTTLPVLLFNEYRKYKEKKKERGWTVKKSKGNILAEIRGISENRQKWRGLVSCISGNTGLDKLKCD